MLEHSGEDRAIVEAQLGRPARGQWAVAARCHLGIPTVIASHPHLDDGSPFPTLFWLTCPILAKRASGLESVGRMDELSDELQADRDMKFRLTDAIARYRAKRDELDVIDDAGAPVGGGPDRVKCLHVHLAQQLADPPNPIGARVLSEIGWPDCRTPCFRARPAPAAPQP